MSGVLNDCDALLQGAAVRIVNPKNAAIILTTDAPAFHVNSSGVADINTITVTATLYDLDGPLTFSAQGAALSNVTDRTATVTYASMTGPTAIITATMQSGGVTFSQSCIIGTTQDGASGASAKVLTLIATEQVFKINKAGANSPASITLTASGQNIVGTPSFTIPVGTATLTAGANASQKVLTFANMTSDSVTVQIALDGLTDRVTIIKVREGADGTPGADAISSVLTNESVTLPASSNGTVSSYAGAVCSMKVFKGVADDTANWTFSYSPASSSSSLTYTGSGGTVSVVTMAAGVDSAYVDITASRSGFASITKRFNVTKSKAGGDGARGPGTYYATGTTWTDGAADAATPGTNVTNDVVTISNGTTFAMTKKWDGSAWVAMGAVYDGSLFVTGSINGAALKVGTVEVRDSSGNLILGAGKSLAQQAASNPNLAPNCLGFRNLQNASANRNGDIRFGDGQYLYFNTVASSSIYVGVETPPLGIPENAWYTVSFDAFIQQGTATSRSLTCDIVGGGVDSAGITVSLTRTMTRYTFMEGMPASGVTARAACLRFFTFNNTDANIVIANIKVELGQTVTPWCDTVITPANADVFMSSAVIRSAHLDRASINALSVVSQEVGTLTSRANGQGAGTTIVRDQIMIYDEGGTLRLLDGRLW